MTYIKVFVDFIDAIAELNYEERGRLFTAMLKYGADPTEAPEFHGNEKFLWNIAKQALDRELASYEKKCIANRANAQKSRPSNRSDSLQDKDDEKDDDEDNDKEKDENDIAINTTCCFGKSAGSFSPPTPEMVDEYCVEHGFDIDPEYFCDYYSARGWMLGNSPMTNWKAALNNWERGGFGA